MRLELAEANELRRSFGAAAGHVQPPGEAGKTNPECASERALLRHPPKKAHGLRRGSRTSSGIRAARARLVGGSVPCPARFGFRPNYVELAYVVGDSADQTDDLGRQQETPHGVIAPTARNPSGGPHLRHRAVVEEESPDTRRTVRRRLSTLRTPAIRPPCPNGQRQWPPRSRRVALRES